MEKPGLKMQDFERFEINEAFASVPLAWMRKYEPDLKKVNPNGGATVLWHPIGNFGSRLLVTCLDELERIYRKHGLITRCTGGGMAPAAIIEKV